MLAEVYVPCGTADVTNGSAEPETCVTSIRRGVESTVKVELSERVRVTELTVSSKATTRSEGESAKFTTDIVDPAGGGPPPGGRTEEPPVPPPHPARSVKTPTNASTTAILIESLRTM